MNALWDRWRKQITPPSQPARSTAGLSPYLADQVRDVLAAVARSCASISVGGAASDPTQSYLTGHPYLPQGCDWPEGEHGPQFFVGQINFAEVGVLEGFPSAGLLQWFVDTDETYGLTFDETAGAAGFSVRWYSDLSAAPAAAPDAPTPTDHVEEVPMEFVGPTRIGFGRGASIPSWDELPAEVRQDTVWERVAMAFGESRSEPAYVYDEYIRGGSSGLTEFGGGSRVGGYPSFTQEDPRGSGAYPAVGTAAATLIIELDSMDVGGWGDSGVGHLFGDPAALVSGDTSGIRYHWDCM
ncbi:hypothetical protein GCM10011575_27350 [Microlunatus endophyticus]|uniref:DUF1963 domain-containing protein n=1 Tax=Microlunatus endophyticus TaxID=1716077 RepID=A0A917W4I6_9ACTN|nr:DUF1963 domain-containing protein [Microlunatus endophyticus]GGL67375.1 hypothetical protein GCM10011575_27350 [Microlunatus endophyticus]